MAQKKLLYVSDVKVLCVIVWRRKLTKPVVLPTVAYRYKHQSDLLFEAIGTMHSSQWEVGTVRGKLNCKHQCGKRLSSNGMVNIYELLINVVTVEEPKMLLGSIQNGDVIRLLCYMLTIRKRCITGRKVGPNPFMSYRGNTVSLYSSSSEEGNPRGKLIRMQVKESGKSECCFVMGQIGIATLSHTKVSRLPLGLLLRENLIKL